MYKENILHPAEQNILLALTLAICLSLYAGWASNEITEYNENVAYKQERLMLAANEGKKYPGDLHIFVCYSTPLWFSLYGLQFLLFPLAFRYLRNPSFRNILKTSCVSFTCMLCFYFWYEYSKLVRDFPTDVPIEKITLLNLIWYEATPYHVTALVLVLILFALQVTFLLRFAAERNITRSV